MVVTFKVRLRRKTEKPELHVECSEGLERAHFTNFLCRSERPIASDRRWMGAIGRVITVPKSINTPPDFPISAKRTRLIDF
jgi:hypothetical protein